MLRTKKALRVAGGAICTLVALAACSSSPSGTSSDGAATTGKISQPKVSTAELNAVLLEAYGKKVDLNSLDPASRLAVQTAAQPVTPKQLDQLLKCMKALGTCDLGRDGLTIGISDANLKSGPFVELGVAAEVMQAIQTPEIGKVIVTDGRGDLQATLANFTSLVNQKVDAILGNFTFGSSMAGVGKQAEAAGIPVVAISQTIANLKVGKSQWFVGVDNCDFGTDLTTAGIKAAQSAGTDKGTVGLYTGPPGNPFGADWIPCGKKAAQKAGWKTTEGFTQWTPQGHLQAVSQIIAAGGNLGVYVSDQYITAEALKALRKSGQPMPVTAGGGPSLDAVKVCLEPGYRCVLGLSPAFYYRLAMTEAMMLARGEKVPANIKVSMPIVTAQELAKRVDINALPPTGQFGFVLSPEIQTALAKNK